MARPNWKFKNLNIKLYKHIFLNKFKSFKLKKIFCRGSVVTKTFLKNAAQIYKGGDFSTILFTKYNLGFKFGELALTRKPFSFPKKKKKK